MIDRFRALIHACRKAGITYRRIYEICGYGYSPGRLNGIYNGVNPELKGQQTQNICAALKKNGHTVEDHEEYFIVDGHRGDPPPPPPPPPPPDDYVLHQGKKIEELLLPHIKNGETRLQVLDTWVNQDNFFINWLKTGQLASLQLLVLDPSGEVLPARLRSLNPDAPYTDMLNYTNYLDRVWESKEKLKEAQGDSSRLNIRLYDELPGMNIFMTEDVIFCAPHLVGKQSGSTFCLEIPRKGESEIAKELSDHFDNIWKEDRRSVALTQERLDAIEEKFAYEGLYKKLAQEYVIYSLDEDPIRPFQTSVIEMNPGKKSCTLRYEDRENPNKIIDIQGKVTFLSVRNHLFLSFRQEEFVLEVLGYFKKPTFIQVLYLHTDTKSTPRISCGIMQAIAPGSVQPSRNYQDIPLSVRKHLQTYEQVPQLKGIAGGIDELLSSDSPNLLFTRKFIGQWKVYYNIRIAPRGKASKLPFIGPVAQSVLSIYKDEVRGMLRCTLDTHDGRKYIGKFMFEDLIANSRGILGMNFTLAGKETTEGKTWPLNFLFSLANRDKTPERLMGAYNIVYTNGKQGCGLAFMERMLEGESVTPQILDPLLMETGYQNIANRLKFLSFKKTSILLPDDNESYRERIQHLPCHTYLVYNYGVQGRRVGHEKKAVVVCAMQIFSSGLVRFRGLRGSESFGFAYVQDKNVHIELHSTTFKRIGYLTIHTGGKDRINDDDVYFSGVFLGTTVHDDFPIGKRILLKKTDWSSLDDFSPTVSAYPHPKDSPIPEPIRKALSGGDRSVTGFLMPNTTIFKPEDLADEIDFMESAGKNLLYSACFQVIHKTKEQHKIDENTLGKIISLLHKAARYGVSDVAGEFEQEIRPFCDQSILDQFFQNTSYQELKALG